MLRTLKFRQRNIRERSWHYWGFINGAWVNPKTDDGYDTPITSNQFTGVVGNYKREIYDGDIVQAPHLAWKTHVHWDPVRCGFNVDPNVEYDVIGNLADNPEYRKAV